MMLRHVGGLAAVMLTASMAAAQQPGTAAPKRDAEGMAGHGRMSMMAMDSMNNRLDSLVARMNRTSGNDKVQAMAAVINELVSQRKLMQDRMHRMMERGGMMGTTQDATPAAPKPAAKPEAAADTGHAAHHPPE
jgi:hypothetical protein